MKRLILAILVVLSLWFLVDPLRQYYFPDKAEPRAVTARGDLAADEQNTINIFKNNSSSVVYVTSIALRRGFFSMNAVEIPQGILSASTRPLRRELFPPSTGKLPRLPVG